MHKQVLAKARQIPEKGPCTGQPHLLCGPCATIPGSPATKSCRSRANSLVYCHQHFFTQSNKSRLPSLPSRKDCELSNKKERVLKKKCKVLHKCRNHNSAVRPSLWKVLLFTCFFVCLFVCFFTFHFPFNRWEVNFFFICGGFCHTSHVFSKHENTDKLTWYYFMYKLFFLIKIILKE